VELVVYGRQVYQQVIDTESYNTLDPTTWSQTLSFYDHSDSQIDDVPGQPAYLVFHADTVQKTNIENFILVNADPHYSKALPCKIDYERLSPYFAFRIHHVIQHPLRQTTQLAKSICHYPMQRHLKSRFQMLSKWGHCYRYLFFFYKVYWRFLLCTSLLWYDFQDVICCRYEDWIWISRCLPWFYQATRYTICT
jgi:hypothetical protein